MNIENKRKVCALTPVEEENIRLSPAKKVSAGIPALVSAARHVSRELTVKSCTKTLLNLNQKGGIDCPGCAWPDPGHRSKLGEYCENGVKAISEESTKRRVEPEFFRDHSVEELSGWSDYKLGKSGRLTHPMILREGSSHYEPISWEDAFERIAGHLNRLNSPDEAVFYTSGRTSNEAAFLYQLFVRQYGTNNLPDCSNMCHESSGAALGQTLGIGKGSVTLEDFYVTDLIIVMGQNPGTNHPRMLSALQKAKRAGAKIITVNPLPEPGLIRFKNPQEVSGILGSGAELTDLFLQVRINQDVPLIKAILKILLEKEAEQPGTVADRDFIREHTDGYEALVEDLEQYRLEELIEMTGIPESQIRQAVGYILTSKKMIVCWAMGLTQHKNGVDNIRELVNLLLLRGSIGKPGAGTCPVRGHSNVQGDRTVGIWERPRPEFLDKLKDHFHFEPPRHHGYDTVNAIKAMAEGKAKVFFAMGGNFLSATPDTEYTAEALQNCSLTVQVSTKLNRSHLVTGKEAIILPCLGRTEIDEQASGQQFVSVENSMGVVHSSQGRLEPASPQLKSEPAIIAGLAKVTLGDTSSVDWDRYIENYDRIRNAIEACIPGFEDYNRRVRNPGGFYLPNGARERKFNNSIGRARFTVNAMPDWQLEDDQFVMMTIRSHDQFNTTIYGLDDRYRGIYNGRRVVLMNEEDMKEMGLEAKEYVDLISHFQGEKRIAPKFMIVPYDIPSRCVATYFPEANVLVPVNHVARSSNTPASKTVIVTIQKQ